jgi:hypothetical protein
MSVERQLAGETAELGHHVAQYRPESTTDLTRPAPGTGEPATNGLAEHHEALFSRERTVLTETITGNDL